jgi:hypothetical protein
LSSERISRGVAAADALDNGSHRLTFVSVGKDGSCCLPALLFFGGSQKDLEELTIHKLTMMVLVFWEQVLLRTDADNTSR